MNIIEKKLSELTPYESNPRLNDEAVPLATGSMDIYVNIVADRACVSARGAKSEGLTDVTCLRGRFQNDEKLRAEVERKCRC